jgi:hypothetical protein
VAAPAPFTPKKVLISVLMVAWLALLLWGLQRKYDAKDYEHVDEMLVAPGAPWSVEKELLSRSSGTTIPCDKELLSSFRGLVRVTCRPAGGETYKFVVDLVQKQIRGEDAKSEQVIAAVDQKRRAGDAGTP